MQRTSSTGTLQAQILLAVDCAGRFNVIYVATTGHRQENNY